MIGGSQPFGGIIISSAAYFALQTALPNHSSRLDLLPPLLVTHITELRRLVGEFLASRKPGRHLLIVAYPIQLVGFLFMKRKFQ